MTSIDSLLLSFTVNLTNLPKILLKEYYERFINISQFAKDENDDQSLIMRINNKSDNAAQNTDCLSI